MKKTKVKDYTEIKIGDLIEYSSKHFLILDFVSENDTKSGRFKVFDFNKMEIRTRYFVVMKHSLFILTNSED